MKCVKCGSEWNANITDQLSSCPFCGEDLMEKVPYQSCVNSLKMIIDQFGIKIYCEEKRLTGLINDLLSNTSIEKRILNTVISFGVPRLILTILTEDSNRTEVLDKAYELMEQGGVSDEWCTKSLYIFAMPLGIDPTDLYPLEDGRNDLDFDISTDFSCYKEQVEHEYFEKSIDELLTLALTEDAIAETELGERYYSGIGIEKDINAAISYFTKAADSGYPVAEYILGKLYDEGQSLPHNPTMAFEYYQKAASKAYPLAQYALGQMYYFGEDCEKNDSEALYWILKAADKLADSDVYIVLASIYMESADDHIRDDRKAFQFAQKAAEMEDENAYNLLGTLYETGRGVEQNYDQALYYYKLAAKHGVELAYLNLGAFYQIGIAVPKDEEKAAEYFQYGANAGNMYCLNALGMCYKNGVGVKQDYKKAFELFLEAAYAGNFAGELNAGLAYDEGQGVQEDKEEAKKWFALAAEHESSKAMFILGVYAEKGIPNGKPDLETAFKWYLKAAEVGDYPFAAWVVGNCYEEGLLNTKIDHCTAFDWYLKAANLGHPTAQNNVACSYFRGDVVDLDYSLATKWYKKAVEQDDMYALNNYGTALLNGNGIPRKIKKGFKMIKKSAKLGYPDAQCNLGICYFEGWGTDRNLDKALRWLIEANDAGVSEALEYLKKGFKEKNGTWIKRGVFGNVPMPAQLPPPSEPIVCKGGCEKLCEYANLQKAEELSYSEKFCFCEFFNFKVFKKKKCPYYKNGLSELMKNSSAEE